MTSRSGETDDVPLRTHSAHADGTERGPCETTNGDGSLSYSLFKCRECSAVAVAVGVHDGSAALSCHGQPVEAVGEVCVDDMPEALTALAEVRGAPEETKEVYRCAKEEGTASVTETAERLGHDRGTVSDRLRNLAEIGFLERYTLEMEGGSSVTVYEPRGAE